MNITIWIVIALVCFVLPAVALTGGGSNAPKRGALAKYADQVGLPLTDSVVDPVVARIRRRERGMWIGGIAAIVLGAVVAMLFGGADTWGALVMPLAGAGVGFGGAWMMATHRPAPTADQPVVARSRFTRLSDYLTRGERFALTAAPPALLVGAGVGSVLLLQLPADTRGSTITVGLAGTALALATWGVARFTLARLLDAPARSGSDLELAWDDAERAFGLRQVADLVTAVSCIGLGLWLLLVSEALTTDGFYRSETTLAYTLTIAALLSIGSLIVAVGTGPVYAGMTGQRKGFEQRQLWPDGVHVS